ncbi:MAG: stage IV sporulation protein A [Gallintestinimicrobium sp.]
MRGKIENAQELVHTLRVLSGRKQEYDRVASAMEAVHTKGYGVVLPCREEIHLEQPEVIRHGNKFGVKIRAESPSLHFIRATVVTEIAPIVGTEQQAKDLIGYIDETGKQDGIWETNIFGKTVEQLVNDGIRTKISMIGKKARKSCRMMQKIVNDSTGGMVCIII